MVVQGRQAREQAGRLPRALADRYVIEEVIGRGGAATVYSAKDRLLDRRVAIKVFAEKAVSAEELRVQQAEARLVAQLHHHALVTLLDAGVDASDPEQPQIYLVMERAPGSDLRQHLRSGPLTAKQVAYLGFDLADGLRHVHDHGYLHRDIKPANVLLDLRDAETRLRGKLTDFGISSIIGSEQGEFTTGTAAYLGPEQVEGEDAVPATDVYSLGLVLLEAATGQVEFPGTVNESAVARLHRDPVVPSSIPDGVAGVLRGMLRRRPEDRSSLTEVSLGLQNALIDELVRERALDPALLAPDEAARTVAMHRFDVLGDAPDEAFDRIAHLATRLLHVPAAFVSMVDADRKIIRASRGLDGALHEVARSEALCAIPVHTGRPVSISDIRADPRIASNPILLDDPRLASYAAAPLVTHDGLSVGALGVFAHTNRTFDEDELHDLADLATVIIRELELRLAARRVAMHR